MKTDNSAVSMSFILFRLLYLLYLSVSRPLVRPSEAGGFGLLEGGGVEFAVGGVYDGFVVVYVEREMVYLFVLVDFDAQIILRKIIFAENAVQLSRH